MVRAKETNARYAGEKRLRSLDPDGVDYNSDQGSMYGITCSIATFFVC